MPSGCAIVFGLPFLIAGITALLYALGIPVFEPEDPVPTVVSFGVGGAFTFVGLFICGYGVLGLLKTHRRNVLCAERPDEPWLADHPWDATGIDDRPFERVLKPLLWGTYVIIFFVPCNYLVFVSGEWDDWFPLIVVCTFNVIGVGFLIYTLYCFVCYLKFGVSSLRFATFPFFLGEKLAVQLMLSYRAREFRSLNMTLRCVEERFEADSDGGNMVVCYEAYADTRRLDENGVDVGDLVIPIEFDLPADGKPTALSERPPVYWELEIKADLPGIDYETTFLVPVYQAPS